MLSAFSFLRLVRLQGEMLKIVMPAQTVLFWKHEEVVSGMQRWCLFLVSLVSVMHINEFIWDFPSLFTMKFVNENINLNRTGKISNFLKYRLLHRVLGHASNVILKIFFCEVISFQWEKIWKHHCVFYAYGQYFSALHTA